MTKGNHFSGVEKNKLANQIANFEAHNLALARENNDNQMRQKARKTRREYSAGSRDVW